jgi:exonuclease III
VTLRVATWNVNSLDVRLSRLFDRLVANAPDIVGPQDCRQPAFPENHGRSEAF